MSFDKAEFIKNKQINHYKKKYIAKKQIKDSLAKRKVDIIYQIIDNLTRRINNILKKLKINRELKYRDFIGCKPSELKIHLQNQFIDDMSYDNYPEWEIDHIIPIDSFDLQL